MKCGCERTWWRSSLSCFQDSSSSTEYTKRNAFPLDIERARIAGNWYEPVVSSISSVKDAPLDKLYSATYKSSTVLLYFLVNWSYRNCWMMADLPTLAAPSTTIRRCSLNLICDGCSFLLWRRSNNPKNGDRGGDRFLLGIVCKSSLDNRSILSNLVVVVMLFISLLFVCISK